MLQSYVQKMFSLSEMQSDFSNKNICSIFYSVFQSSYMFAVRLRISNLQSLVQVFFFILKSITSCHMSLFGIPLCFPSYSHMISGKSPFCFLGVSIHTPNHRNLPHSLQECIPLLLRNILSFLMKFSTYSTLSTIFLMPITLHKISGNSPFVLYDFLVCFWGIHVQLPRNFKCIVESNNFDCYPPFPTFHFLGCTTLFFRKFSLSPQIFSPKCFLENLPLFSRNSVPTIRNLLSAS